MRFVLLCWVLQAIWVFQWSEAVVKLDFFGVVIVYASLSGIILYICQYVWQKKSYDFR